MSSSVSNDIPGEVMLKGKARVGDIGDFAILLNLWPGRRQQEKESEFEAHNKKGIIYDVPLLSYSV